MMLTVFVVYGSTKPPSSTNEPPASTSGDSTNEPPIIVEGDATTNTPPDTTGDEPTNPPPMMCFSPRPMMSPPPNYQLPSTNCQLLTAWNKRGAWLDWQRIEFGGSFSFPSGTNLLTGVTLFSYGELRESLQLPTTICQLPTPVSLEPGASSVTYGLTPSNTFLVSWLNCCVDRDPTNRVDASIELFRNGSIAIRTASDVQPPTFNLQPPVVPEGYYGQGQDEVWLQNAFSPADYASITNKGYARWLDEDYVGYNEENGHYKYSVTVHSMPPNDQPCYLVCGPYKMIVKEPGTYDFPLEVFNEYPVRTYPTQVLLSATYDEGYYPDDDDYGPLMSPLNQSAPMLLGSPSPTPLTACMIPALHLSPSIIPLEQAANTCIRLWCNMRHVAWRFEALVEIGFMVTFDSRNIARITDAITTYGAEGIIYDDGHPEVYAHISLIPSYYPWPWPHDPDPTNGCYTGGSDTNNTTNGQTP